MNPLVFKEKVKQLELQLNAAERLRREFDEFKRSFQSQAQSHANMSKQIISAYLRECQKRHEIDRWETQEDKKFCQKVFEQDHEILKKSFQEQSQGFPTLAKAFGDYLELRDDQIANYLEHKPHPAVGAAETVRAMKSERKTLEQKYRELQYLLLYYEEIFPFLAEYREIDNIDSIKDKRIETDGDPVRELLSGLSQEEYESLSRIQKFQRALDKYWTRRKSSWQLGRDYERYVGYLYEQQKYEVYYQGIIKGFEDCGRDLVCQRGEEIVIVQCKYWAHNKIIHEKHINQLFGTCVEFWISRNGSKPIQMELFPEFFKSHQITPCITTSTTLSDTAHRFAEALGVKVEENIPLQKYPCIKCNVSRRTGERIYHLPFDQQYDSTTIEKEKNECYVETVAEAEERGFRRAFEWHGENQ